MAVTGEPLSESAFPPQNVQNDDGLSAFASVRSRLFGIAYRMLGSRAEADDVVQEVWLRWQSANRTAVENPFAFLATITSRLCINVARSARVRHETYIGVWFPEPLDVSSDPSLSAERGEALRFAIHLLLGRLSPTERAAYVLREAFDYSYRQIAGTLQLAEANTRQLVSRARKHIADGPRKAVTSGEQRRFLNAFIAAAEREEIAELECFFAGGVSSHSYRAGLFARDTPQYVTANAS